MRDERRQSRRFPPAIGRDEALITYKRRTDIALIVNVSAGGFRVCVQEGFRGKVSDEVQLETTDGCHVVRIANAQQEGERLYLGLERIRDLPPGTRSQIARAKSLEHGQGHAGSGGAKLLTMLVYVGVPLLLAVALLMVTVGVSGVRNMIHDILRIFGI